MKFLLFTVLLYCAVKCDDVGNNYYVIEIPDDAPVNNKKPFRVYWNVPTMQCKSKKIPFNDLYEKYNIIQNEGDKFRGEEITILYEPGLFPAIFKNETSGKYRFRNGGVPQEGNMEEHLKVFRKDMAEIVPDPNFSGLGIIDFESWRPIFRQNFGTLVPYKDVSIEIEKKLHWWWPKTWIQTEAQRRFEEAARRFMQTTLSIAKQMRPKALWGYYGFPHCFNMASMSNMNENCPKNVMSENDVTNWLWLESTALYPSVYSSRDLSSSQLGLLVRGRVEEAHRVRRYDTPIFPYFWFRYRDGGFMKEEDLAVVLQSLHKSNASGFIIWGSSNDVNTESKCQNLHDYVERILGPTIAKYIQKINRLDDDQVETPTESNINEFNETLLSIDDITNTTDPSIVNETNDNNNSNEFVRRVQFDPEFDWMPPENYSQDISQNVEEELLRKGYNSTGSEGIELKNLNGSAVADIIIDAILNSEYSKENNQQNIRDMENGTTTTTSSSTTTSKYTESPQLSNDENLYVTEEPVNVINKFLRTDIVTNYILNSTPKLNSETLIHDVQKDSEKVNNISDVNISTEVNLNSATENKSINTFSDGSYNKEFKNSENSMLKENNSLSNDFLKDNQTNGKEILLKNINENMAMNLIFNALIKQNIIDENNKQSVYTDLQNSDNTKNTNAQKEEIYFVTTQKSIRVARDDLIQTDLGKSLENLEIAKDIITDITSTTDTPVTAKEDEFLDLISLEDKLSSRDFKNLSTELDDFLIVLKSYSEPKSDTTTQNNIKEIDYENNYLIILSVNMNDTTNANATSGKNDEDQNVDESTIENLSAISVNDNLSNINSEESTISSQTESSTDIFVTNSEDSEHFKVFTDVTNDILSSTPKFNSESLIRNVQKDSEKIDKILDVKITTEVSFISKTENQSISISSDDPRNREFTNTEDSTSKENNSPSNYLLKENQTNSNKMRLKNTNANIVNNLIFNASIKHNIIDENNKQSVYTELQNSDNTKSTEPTEKTDTQREEIYFVTTQKSIREGASDDSTQSDLEKSLENLKIARDIVRDITSTTDTPITAKEDESFDLISSEDTLSNRDFKNSSTELDDFLIVLKNYTEPKSDTTAQNNIKQIDYEDNYLIILSVNMNDTTNANATSGINDKDQNVNESTVENLSEISESDSLSNINSKESTISSQTETSTDIFVINSEDSEHLKVSTGVSEVNDSTTEPTVDQMVTYINYV